MNRPATVWFNAGIAAADAARSVRDADRASGARRLRVLASDRSSTSAAALAADGFLRDRPLRTPENVYIDWLLETCRRERVDVLFGGVRRDAMDRHRDAFDAAGVRLVVPGPAAAIDLAARKDACYATLAGTGVAIPEHAVARTADELAAAYEDLRTRHAFVCAKPLSGVGGAGYRVFVDGGREPPPGWAPPGADMPFGRFLRRWGADPRRAPLMIMEHLPGEERSVDCLAHEGRLVTSVIRAKRGDAQVIEDHPAVAEAARLAAQTLGMTGVFNLQTKDARELPHLIEINARLSGGTLYSALSGTCLPYWAVLLALGWARPEDVPPPVAGTVILPIQSAIAFPPGSRLPAARPGGSLSSKGPAA